MNVTDKKDSIKNDDMTKNANGNEKDKDKNNNIIVNLTDKKKKQKELIKRLFGGAGYSSYKNFITIGSLDEIANDDSFFINKIKLFLDNLTDNKTYTVLGVIRWINNMGESTGITLGSSIKLTSKNSPKIISDKFKMDIWSGLLRYNLDESDCELVLMYREWLDISEFNSKIEVLTDTMDKILINEMKINKLSDTCIQDRLNMSPINNYKHAVMNNYGSEIIVNNKLIGYKLSEYEGLVVKKMTSGNGEEFNLVTVKELINGQFNIEMGYNNPDILQWKDIKTNDGFIREMSNIKFYFNHENSIYKTEGEYSYPYFPVSDLNYDYDSKIGAIDFETYGSDNGSLGSQNAYAGGWAVNDQLEMFYIKPNESSEELVSRVIESIFKNEKLNGYTFFAHNMGRFDSLFLIKGVIKSNNISIKPIWKDNQIISLSIKNTELNRKILILDSILFIPGNLRNILKSFNCTVNKGYFPYKFVNHDTLFYSGDKPDIRFYENIPLQIYKLIPIEWKTQTESLKYLQGDLVGLLELMNKFSYQIFKEYNLNITKFKTLPSLALGIYTTNFYDESETQNIKMIKGKVEDDIRSGYFGGNVGVYVNEILQGYLYDMNSQYPAAMLEDMPVGNPVYTTEKDLNKIFGFVYGKVTAPSEDNLRVATIQYKDPVTKTVSCPRGEFYRMIFTEEIKDAIKYEGYKFEVYYGYKFGRGKIFDKYVNKHFEIKKNATDPIKRQISKLLLNSLYGKFGMKDIQSVLKILPIDKANKILKTYNCSIFANLNNNKILVKYSSRINESLRLLFKDHDILNNTQNYKMNEIGLGKKKGVSSAVQISAAISSYARIKINKFKNIPGNPCIMSDTDSVVLTKPLPDCEIGKELGQMKLEHEIKHGIFIRKKLYALTTAAGKDIIKASGTNSKSLIFEDFIDLLEGKSVDTKRISFNVEWDKMNVQIVENTVKLKGLNDTPIKYLVSNDNQNERHRCRAISFPKLYPILVISPISKDLIIFVAKSKALNVISVNRSILKKIIDKVINKCNEINFKELLKSIVIIVVSIYIYIKYIF